MELSFTGSATEKARKLLENLRTLAAKTGQQCIEFKIIHAEHPIELIREGISPIFLREKGEPEYYYGLKSLPRSFIKPLIIEDLLYGLTEEEILFWYKRPTKEYLDTRFSLYWRFCTIEEHKKRAEKSGDSLPLILYAPDQVYEKSKRPKTDMQIFRTPGAITVNRKELILNDLLFGEVIIPIRDSKWSALPVTRYAEGMSRGLYFTTEDPETKYCGTFYYSEPLSSTYLAFRTKIVFRNKYIAYLELSKMLGEKNEVSAHFILEERTGYVPFIKPYLLGQLNLPEDLMFTPQEACETFSQVKGIPVRLDRDLAYKIPQRKRYLGEYLALYAAEDGFDQEVCLKALKLGYDIVIFTHMIGSHQIVTEILDTRERVNSFDSLVYVVE